MPFNTTTGNTSSGSALYISCINIVLNQMPKNSSSIKLLIDGKKAGKRSFDDKILKLRWDLKPFLTLRQGSKLVIQLREHRLPWPTILAEALLSFQTAQTLVLSAAVGQYQEHRLRDNPLVTIEFADNSGALQTMLESSVEISAELKSLLDHLGKSKAFLETMLQVGSAVSELHPIAKAVLSSINLVHKQLKVQEDCHKLILGLADSMACTLGYIEDVEQFARLVQLKKAIEEVQPLMEDTANFILMYTSHSGAGLFQSDRDKIDDLSQKFESFKQQFDRGLLVQSGVTIEKSGATLEILLQNMMSEKHDKLLEELKPKDLDRGLSKPECMEGTRQDILGMIDEWVDDFEAPNILWLRGFPGSGKSAIASTLVAKLRKSHRLGSSFFFERDKAILTTPAALWRTVAYDFARLYSSARKVIVAKLDEDEVSPNTANVEMLFRHLIEEPLKASNNILPARLPVVVVDALDECGGLEGHRSRYRKSLLNTLKNWSSLSPTFKLVVTSRGEDDIIRVLSPLSHHVSLSSGKTVSLQSSSDIRRFLSQRFEEIASSYEDSLPQKWPGSSVIEELTERSAGLFIWAKTFTEFAEEGDPQDQLLQIQKGDMGYGDLTTLYTRILDISFRNPSPLLAECFNVVAGTIILAKIPLSRNDFIHLFAIEPISMLDTILKGLQSVLDSNDRLRFSHQSFVDFLIDSEKCPPTFLIHAAARTRGLVLASLRIMKTSLRFNICQLESSHVFNDDIPRGTSRIIEAIPPHLSYSCRFWADHLQETPIEPEILQGIKDLMYIRFLYWLEVLSLIKEVNIASKALSSAVDWITGQDKELSVFITDAMSFVTTFRNPISQSAPHIYLSALPFSPTMSLVAQQFLPQFPRLLSVDIGISTDWPIVGSVLEGHTGAVRSVAFSPDSKQIVSGSNDLTVRVWDVETGEVVSGPFEGHNAAVWSVSFSPDGRQIVSAADSGTVYIWDVESGETTGKPFGPFTTAFRSVAFSLDGRYIIVDFDDNFVPQVWNIETGKLANDVRSYQKVITSSVVSPDGKRRVGIMNDHTVQVWDAKTHMLVYPPFEGHIDKIWSVAFSPDGGRIVSGSSDQTIRVWDAGTVGVTTGSFEGHTAGVTSVAISPDGQHIASGSLDMTIRIWNAVTGKLVSGPFQGHTNKVWSVVYSPDARHIVSGSWDGTVRVWDNQTGNVVSKFFQGSEAGVCYVAISRDGKRIVSGSLDWIVRVWDIKTGVSTLFKGHTDEVWGVAFSPDGKRVVSSSHDRTVRVWDVELGVPVNEPFIGHTSGVWSVAYSPDGKRIVSGSRDQTIRVWDAETGEVVAGPFMRHTDEVWCVMFSPDGSRIASGSDDKTLLVWDLETGDVAFGPFEGHTAGISSVAFSPDGKQIVSCSYDQTVRVWDTSLPMDWLDPATTLPTDHSENDDRRPESAGMHSSSTFASGWMIGGQSQLLFWVPPSNRIGLWRPTNTVLIGKQMTKLNFDQFVHGMSWHHCLAVAKARDGRNGPVRYNLTV